ncbi:hypothetical protein, partial [Gemmatimonas sp.]|uniref:hypothetical protein n=1 Tax=Gemmatimonas sp. TaxID=1962908 RepID=UPI003983B2BE
KAPPFARRSRRPRRPAKAREGPRRTATAGVVVRRARVRRPFFRRQTPPPSIQHLFHETHVPYAA